ncbi:uncharacterized protein LOC100376953 [Saccoglossus kowalevskii]
MTTKGFYKYPDGEEYSGEWLDGKRHGIGMLSLVDSSQYVGGFEDGLCSGHGVMTFPDGSRYVYQMKQIFQRDSVF